jgi:hypothetical protein
VDADLEVAEALDQRAGGACVVEVDVSEQKPARAPLDPLQQGVEAGRRPGVDQRVVQLPAADRAVGAEMKAVDQPAAGRAASLFTTDFTI